MSSIWTQIVVAAVASTIAAITSGIVLTLFHKWFDHRKP